MSRDVFGGMSYPGCPSSAFTVSPLPRTPWDAQWTANGTFHLDIPHPNSTLGLGSMALTLGVLGLTTALLFQSVIILNRRNAHPSLQNGWWAATFLLWSSSFFLDFFRYALDLSSSSEWDSLLDSLATQTTGTLLLVMASSLRRLASVALSASLAQHLRYVSCSPLQESTQPDETSPLLLIPNDEESFLSSRDTNEEVDSSMRSFLRTRVSGLILSSKEFINHLWLECILLGVFLILLLLHLYLVFPVQVSFLLFLSLSLAQIYPIFWRTRVCLAQCSQEFIRRHSQVGEDEFEFSAIRRGPSAYANSVLSLGIALTSVWSIEPSHRNYLLFTLFESLRVSQVCIIPPYLWGSKDEKQGWASPMDVMDWIGLCGSLLLFYYMKLEFDRHSKNWIWWTVRQVQSAFNFRS